MKEQQLALKLRDNTEMFLALSDPEKQMIEDAQENGNVVRATSNIIGDTIWTRVRPLEQLYPTGIYRIADSLEEVGKDIRDYKVWIHIEARDEEGDCVLGDEYFEPEPVGTYDHEDEAIAVRDGIVAASNKFSRFKSDDSAMDLGEALEIVTSVAKSFKDLSQKLPWHSKLVQALDTVEDFVSNNFEEGE